MFFQNNWDGFTGEFAELSIEFDVGVKFLEDGCLENEYIYVDEDGDPIPEKFTPVPIELYPYRHYIKSRCF